MITLVVLTALDDMIVRRCLIWIWTRLRISEV